MKGSINIRVLAWIELVIWLIIVSVADLGIRFHNIQSQKQYKSYQIYIEDVDELIVGSPVRFRGIQVGYVKKIQIISSQVFVKFIITEKI